MCEIFYPLFLLVKTICQAVLWVVRMKINLIRFLVMIPTISFATM